jgi:hypothetical protein
VNDLIADCEGEIAKLPPAPEDDPSAEVMSRITQLSTDLKNAVYGKEEQKQLSQKNRGRYLTFKREILGTAPDFRPFHSGDYGSSTFVGGEASRIPNPKVKPLYLTDVSDVIER